ncbi:hypothetical protein BH23PLA1_BH23PLA1_38820 [soil metagenome]
MTRFRPFRNGDLPALAEIWNAALPEEGVVRPIDVHELDALLISRLFFDPAGLILAEQAGRVVGFAHAGFGPKDPRGPSQQLDRSMGTVAMLAVAPEVAQRDVEQGLLDEAARYLRGQGATVLYAGGRYPLNPFYWGLYGGSEFSGILETHRGFLEAVEQAGYRPVARTIRLEADVTRRPAARAPKSLLLRRQTQLEIREDSLFDRWWDALSIGSAHPVAFVLIDRAGHPVARASTWEMAGFERIDGRSRMGLVGLEVHPDQRRKGLGRLLLGEILRYASGQMAEALAVQTDSANTPARGLYAALGFQEIGATTLYRLDPPG